MAGVQDMLNDLAPSRDPLTIAYLAIGAHSALRSFREANPDANLDRFNGELGYIENVVNNWWLLDKMAEPEDLSGVFVYEVAQPFGEEYGRRLLDGETDINAMEIAVPLVKGCCA